jgi:hypothetical protein
LRVKIVTNLEELERYRYSGHRALMGKEKIDWQDTEGCNRKCWSVKQLL